nr:uncharacterized protein LOC111427339 [Onthophagus taurus]
MDMASNFNDDAQHKIYPKHKENWRINVLSVPTKRIEKYVPPPYAIFTGVNPAALKAPIKPRDKQLAMAPLTKLINNKKTYAHNPAIRKDYVTIMDTQIHHAWNNIYNEYKKVRHEKHLKWLQSRKGKRGKKPPSKGGKGAKDSKAKGVKSIYSMNSAEYKKHVEEWLETAAKPKPVPEAPPVDRGPHCNIDDIKEHIDALSTPPTVKEKYVEPPPPKHLVKESALLYVPTERVQQLATIPPRMLIKEPEFKPGAVKRGALMHKTTEYDNKMSVPRARASANDADLKEDPFSISKNALKYKASPRIIELAKPQARG